jgi:uncharacterized RDD family membrane protein YckC
MNSLHQDQHSRRTNLPGDENACGLIRLLLVLVYDTVIVVAILMIAGSIALALPFKSQVAGKDPWYTIYLVSFWFFYLAWCWRHGGMTLGMRAWKVRLLSTTGYQPSWQQCLVRFAASLVSAIALAVGYWWMLIDKNHRTWHDRLSKTRLVHRKTFASDGSS